MHVQRVVVPGSGAESWTVLNGDGVPGRAGAERYLAYLTDVERSPGHGQGLRI